MGTRGSKRDSVSPKRRKQERGRKKRKATSLGATGGRAHFWKHEHLSTVQPTGPIHIYNRSGPHLLVYNYNRVVFASNQNYYVHLH